ncbi:hypothetical protein [Chryseobacterium sp. SC28]|uniref:hypothetical protein n=1 Tax=Chryseobacterium sp. SC28 TaxID=2268028 RepID=UPI000F64A28C|nr:hypothetical protein [Chryseobacterium sp. SC28]RRQ45502.1 hypothetical protein DTW91_10055 [Chryseobacterium sp. SC28]
MRHILFLVLLTPAIFYCQVNEFKLSLVQTTLLEMGAKKRSNDITIERKNYSKKKYFYNPKLALFIIKGNHKCDTIRLGKKMKIADVINDENSKLYPTDVIDDCIVKEGKNCSISQSLLNLIGEKKIENIQFSFGEIKNDVDNKGYVFYYLNRNRYALLINNDFLLLSFSKK